jgi:glutaredoxin
MTERDICNPKPSKIVMYTASWCPDCKRAKAFLEDRGIEHLEVDIGKDNESYRFLERITRRVRIPTIIFPDGTLMIEPADSTLAAKLEKR